METQKQQARRAIEALRSGVPNRDAVSVLDCSQTTIQNLFKRNMERMRDGHSNGSDCKGIIIKGGFGRGKSHLLEYLQHMALEEKFICSKIVISKETPLYDPVKLFRAAANTAVIEGKRGSAIAEVAENIDVNGTGYADLREWTHTTNEISQIFAATVFLLSRLSPRNAEERDRIFRFWEGEKLGVAEIRRYLREWGEAATYKIDKVSLRELALQRFKFIPRLMQAAGHSGWVLLIDEVELIGCYSMRQRAKSYAELARWRGDLKDSIGPGLTTVFAITADFEEKILSLSGKNDLENIPAKLRTLGLSDMWLEIADCAEKGMYAIQKASIELKEPSEELRKQIFTQIREIYTKAYNWTPPITSTYSAHTSTRMREFIRGWITGWDLKRLYPNYDSVIEVNEIGSDYSENEDLQPNEETN